MGELTLFCGPANPNANAACMQYCAERLQTGRSATFFYLLPSRRQAQHVRHCLVRDTPATAVELPYILGLDDFVDTLYRLVPQRRALLPPETAHLLIGDILQAGAQDWQHFRFSRRESSAGLTRELTRCIIELRQTGLSADEFAQHCTHLPELAGPKGADLAAVYRAYQQRLDPHWSDRPGALQAIAAALDAHSLERYFKTVDLFLISGFSTFSRPLTQLLDRLFDLLPQSCVQLDLAPGNDVFAHTERTFAYLEKRAAHIETTASPTDAPTVPLLEVIPCDHRLDEVEQIARRIKDLHREQSVPLECISVSFRAMETYAPLVDEVFARYGLPFAPRQYTLARAPIIVALLAIFDVVLERYSRSALLRLLGLPYIEFRWGDDAQGHLLTAAALDTWARTLEPAKGQHEWLWQIDLRCEQLQREINRLQTGYLVSDEVDHPERSAHHLERELEHIVHLKEGLQALFAVLAPLERSLTLPAFRTNLLSIIQRLRLSQNLLPNPQQGEQLETIARDGCAYARSENLLDQIAVLAPCLKKKKFALRELNDALRTALGTSHCQTSQAQDAGVQIIPPDQLHAIPCDYLFLGGMVEGEFPRLPRTDIFLDEKARRDLGLMYLEETLSTDRLLFHQAVNHARQGTYLLHPQGSTGEALPPSSFIENLQPSPSASTARHQPQTIYTVADLHAAIGRTLDPQLTQGVRTAPTLALALPRLVRGIHLANQRNRLDALGAYDGLLDDKNVLQDMGQRFGRGHAFSITQLETYARCPFAFFADRILGAVPLPDPERELTALERGNLIHHALYLFYSERRAPVRDTDLIAARARLRQIVRTEAETMGLTGFFWEREIERLIGRDEEGTREGLLERFLRLEAAELDVAAPALFELSFGNYPGMGPRDPLSSPEPFVIDAADNAAVRIFGKIDRIDRTAEGQFVVLDYKTGHVPDGLEDIRQGVSLQLPIYLMAVESLLGPDAGLTEGVAGVYYQLRDHEHCGKTRLFADKAHKGQVYNTRARTLEHDQFRQLMDQAKSFALRYVEGMRSGRFHVTRHSPEKTCVHCPYAQSCRLDPRRMRSLDREDLLP